MQKLIAFLFIGVLAIPSHGQLSQGRYASRITPDGTIFFINPQKLRVLTNVRRFEYDMTLSSWKDSVTVNFTFESSIIDAPEDLKIVSGERTYQSKDFSVLFIDIKKHHYEVRITSKFSVHELTEILKANSLPVFTFTQNGVQNKATYKDNKWKKERKQLLDILRLYSYSKKLIS